MGHKLGRHGIQIAQSQAQQILSRGSRVNGVVTCHLAARQNRIALDAKRTCLELKERRTSIRGTGGQQSIKHSRLQPAGGYCEYKVEERQDRLDSRMHGDGRKGTTWATCCPKYPVPARQSRLAQHPGMEYRMPEGELRQDPSEQVAQARLKRPWSLAS
jgi:hypothetical protein